MGMALRWIERAKGLEWKSVKGKKIEPTAA